MKAGGLKAAMMIKQPRARSVSATPSCTAGACLRRGREAGIGWLLPDDLDDDALESPTLPGPDGPRPRIGGRCRTSPTIHRELRRKGVTLQLVWEEFRIRRRLRRRMSRHIADFGGISDRFRARLFCIQPHPSYWSLPLFLA